MEYRITRSDDYLEHFGVKGQKHGVRRFQNTDGSLTAEGREHYGVGDGVRTGQGTATTSGTSKQNGSFISRHKKGLAIAGGVLAAGLAAYGISKLVNNNNTKKGAESVKQIMAGGKDGYHPDGTVFKIQGNKGAVEGYYSPEMAKHMRIMNGGSLPGSHAKNFASTTRRNAEHFRKQASRDIAKKQQLVRDLDRMQEDILKRYGYK